MTSPPSPLPRLTPWLAGLVALQIATTTLLFTFAGLLGSASRGGGFAVVGQFLGAQALGAILDSRHPGQSRALRHLLSLAAMTAQVALGLVYYLVFEVPQSAVIPDPKKLATLALFVVLVSSAMSYGLSWLGLTSGIRLMEKQRKKGGRSP